MMASSSWKRIDCARAFSSDMWLTPKNWLSPNSRRSITHPFALEPADRMRGRLRDDPRESPPSAAASRGGIDVLGCASVDAPRSASASIIAITRSVSTALAKEFTPSSRPSRLRRRSSRSGRSTPRRADRTRPARSARSCSGRSSRARIRQEPSPCRAGRPGSPGGRRRCGPFVPQIVILVVILR